MNDEKIKLVRRSKRVEDEKNEALAKERLAQQAKEEALKADEKKKRIAEYNAKEALKEQEEKNAREANNKYKEKLDLANLKKKLKSEIEAELSNKIRKEVEKEISKKTKKGSASSSVEEDKYSSLLSLLYLFGSFFLLIGLVFSLLSSKTYDYSIKETVEMSVPRITFNILDEDKSLTFDKDLSYKGSYLHSELIFKNENKGDYFLCLKDKKTKILNVCYYAKGQNIDLIKDIIE